MSEEKEDEASVLAFMEIKNKLKDLDLFYHAINSMTGRNSNEIKELAQQIKNMDTSFNMLFKSMFDNIQELKKSKVVVIDDKKAQEILDVLEGDI